MKTVPLAFCSSLYVQETEPRTLILLNASFTTQLHFQLKYSACSILNLFKLSWDPQTLVVFGSLASSWEDGAFKTRVLKPCLWSRSFLEVLDLWDYSSTQKTFRVHQIWKQGQAAEIRVRAFLETNWAHKINGVGLKFFHREWIDGSVG